MALPPEPLAEILPLATRIVLAEVLETTGDRPADSASQRPPIGGARPQPEQRVRLKVTKTLRGAEARELTAFKPSGAYWLVPGNKGPFLLDNSEPEPRILGRYGPDTYPLAALEQALSSQRS